MTTKKFTIERQDDGSWKKVNGLGSGAVMTLDVAWIEEKLHEYCRQNKSIVGGITDNEYIKRVTLGEDGTLRVNIGLKSDT